MSDETPFAKPNRSGAKNVVKWHQNRKNKPAPAKPPNLYETNRSQINLDFCRNREYLLTNGLGGYSSSTICGLNTRKYHGILIRSDNNLKRWVGLLKLNEEFIIGKGKYPLMVDEYADGSRINGVKNLSAFSYNLNQATFKYDAAGVKITKTLSMIPGENAALASYELENNSGFDCCLKIWPLTASRSIHSLCKGRADLSTENHAGHGVSVKSRDGYVFLFSQQMKFNIQENTHQNLYYSME
ncbi:MAG: hypothetical protein GF334_01260, partial [Candidatus Altiarchaeales archaeon]|nr:hypothetical protein [Candidatus Altiarchaeales archaeon]